MPLQPASADAVTTKIATTKYNEISFIGNLIIRRRLYQAASIAACDRADKPHCIIAPVAGKKTSELPLVAIIGRPNVGKSTIFNRLVGGRVAIVDEMEGVTRDRIYGESEWEGNRFRVVDCGGIARESADPLHEIVSENALAALREADLVLFVVDAKLGITAADEMVRHEIWKAGKPVIAVANKVDSKKDEADSAEVYSLGFEDMVAVSAISGRYFHMLLDLINDKLGYEPPAKEKLSRAERKLRKELAGQGGPLESKEEAQDEEESSDVALDGDVSIFEHMKAEKSKFSLLDLEEVEPPESDDSGEDEEDSENDEDGAGDDGFFDGRDWSKETIRVAFLGRQNVGKSSIANALIDENRIIVSDLPGTTRDPIEVELEWNGRRFSLLDTAGLKKHSRIKESVDFYSMVRTEKKLPQVDVTVLVIDAVEGIYEMDKLVAKKIGEEGKAVVVAVNKWDLAEDHPEVRAEYMKYVNTHLKKITWAEIVFMSALKRFGLDELMNAIVSAWDEYHRKVDNATLLEVLTEEITLHPAPVMKNNPLRIYDVRQVAICPPTFKFWVNLKKSVHFSYRGFLENAIREHFGLRGTFIKLIFQEKKKRAMRR